MECLQLRVKDLDFASQQIVVRNGQGAQDRLTLLPQTLVAPLQRHLIKVQALHEEDVAEGYGDVDLPYALARTYPNAGQAWVWQYVFPTAKRRRDPRFGVERRHHVSATVLQKAVKEAIQRAGIAKHGTCHTLRKVPPHCTSFVDRRDPLSASSLLWANRRNAAVVATSDLGSCRHQTPRWFTDGHPHVDARSARLPTRARGPSAAPERRRPRRAA
jgi:integrase